MNEEVILSLTTWSKRIGNIPAVLDTIYLQSFLPDKIVLNLAYDETIPTHIQAYIDSHGIEVFRTEDTKVYKKLIPTLRRYPNDIIISIDDDWLYPEGMIADFLEIHRKYPNNPISGNRVVYKGMLCHCGCASLTKAEYYGNYLNEFDVVIPHCPCDDIAYTFFANKAGHPYLITEKEYFTNLTAYNEVSGYSEQMGYASLENSYKYLFETYGEPPHTLLNYIEDNYMSSLFDLIHQACLNEKINETRIADERLSRQTREFRLGRAILHPGAWLRSIIKQ